MRRYLHLPLALVLLSAAACEPALSTTAPLSASSSSSLDASPTVPFRLVLTGNANPDFSRGPCDVANSESGTGVAEHMGRVTWTSTETANFCADPTDPTLALVNGTMVATAANGDQVVLKYATTVHADFAAGTLVAAGDYTVAGGTGRFTGATGGGTVNVSGSLAPPFGVTGTFAGNVAY